MELWLLAMWLGVHFQILRLGDGGSTLFLIQWPGSRDQNALIRKSSKPEEGKVSPGRGITSQVIVNGPICWRGRVPNCARFSCSHLFTWGFDLYILQTLLAAFRLSCFPKRWAEPVSRPLLLFSLPCCITYIEYLERPYRYLMQLFPQSWS